MRDTSEMIAINPIVIAAMKNKVRPYETLPVSFLISAAVVKVIAINNELNRDNAFPSRFFGERLRSPYCIIIIPNKAIPKPM